MSSFRYDLAPGSVPPLAGEAIAAVSRATGETTGTWHVIVAVRPVKPRRPHPFDRWQLTLERQDGPPPADAWRYTSYPKGTDIDAYWEARS